MSWGDDKIVMGGRQNCRVNDDKNVVLTIEGTTGRTSEENTHQGVCDSASLKEETLRVNNNDTNISAKKLFPHQNTSCPRPAPVSAAVDAAYDDSSGETPPRPYNDEFEQFRRIYPKQIDEKNAYRAFVAAVKDNNGDVGTIIQGAYMCANWCKVELIKPEQQRYIPYPERWLDKKAWTDRARMLDGATNDPNRPSLAMANHSYVLK